MSTSSTPGGQPAAGAAPGQAKKPKRHKKPRRRPAAKQAGGKPQQPAAEARAGEQPIVTKRPVWAQDAPAGGAPSQNGEKTSSRPRRRRGKKGGGQKAEQPAPAATKQQPPAIPKNEKGIFNFSDQELAEDTSLRLVSAPREGDVKFASFEEFLQDRQHEVPDEDTE